MDIEEWLTNHSGIQVVACENHVPSLIQSQHQHSYSYMLIIHRMMHGDIIMDKNI